MPDPRSRPLCSRWVEAYCVSCLTMRYMYEGNEVTFDGPRTGPNRLVKAICSSCYREDVYKTDESTRKDMDQHTIVQAA